MERREALLEAATDHVVEHGLLGLTLRPLAAAIGTSDRMLIYHFGSRDGLVSAVVNRASERGMAAMAALPAATGVADAVVRLWAAYQEAPLSGCLDVYCQAATEGLIGREPYLSDVRATNERWATAMRGYFLRSGAPDERVGRLVTLIDSALYGFHLDLTTDRPDELARGISDLGLAAELIVRGELG